MFALFLEFRATTRLSPYSHIVNQADFLIWPKGEIYPGKQSGQPGPCEEALGTTLRGGSRKLRKERWGNVSALPAIIMLGIIIRFWETAHQPLP